MAWNEPGNGKDQDPWGNKGDQGPPDLDQAFRKLQNNLSSLFGGGSGGGGPSKPMNFNVIGLFGVALLIIYFALGVYQVDEQEKGVVLRFGKALPTPILPGLHWNPPIIDQV